MYGQLSSITIPKKTYLWSKAPGWAQKGITNEDQPEDWVHLTVTHDIDSDVSIYYDGKKVGGGAKPPAIIEIGGSIMVGARHPGSEFFTGTIDEVYLFNRVLTQAEIDAIRTGVFLPVEPKGKLAYDMGCYKSITPPKRMTPPRQFSSGVMAYAECLLFSDVTGYGVCLLLSTADGFLMLRYVPMLILCSVLGNAALANPANEHYQRGIAYSEAGQYQKALTAFDEAIRSQTAASDVGLVG